MYKYVLENIDKGLILLCLFAYWGVDFFPWLVLLIPDGTFWRMDYYSAEPSIWESMKNNLEALNQKYCLNILEEKNATGLCSPSIYKLEIHFTEIIFL